MTTLYQIDRLFAQRIIEMRGAAGLAWIGQLPATIAESAHRWSLTVQPSFANLSYNYVAPAIRADGSRAVLKLGYPADQELRTEIAALQAFAGHGHGMVRLLAADPVRAVMLLARVSPGVPLTSVADDAAATAIAANLMRDFWPPVPTAHDFPSVMDWGTGFQRLRSRFEGGAGPIPARLADKAERLFAELSQSQAVPVLLHGDLHHDNILSAGDTAWVAIDPKGVTGEPAYELGAFLRNPGTLASDSEARRKTERRIAIFADSLALDPDRIRGWAMAQSVLSAWWSIDDNSDWLGLALTFAELFDEISR